MKLKIYQSFYEESQREFLDPSFTPYDNCKNEHPELAEYPILNDLYSQNKEYDGHWGMMSWRFGEKTKITGEQFIDLIKANPGYDVYHFNPYPNIHKEYNNPFVQGEAHHPGLINSIDLLLLYSGIPMNIEEQVFDEENFIYCSYYVGNLKFWQNWIEFQDHVLSIAKNDLALNYFLYDTKTKNRETYVINFPFVFERLVTLFLHLNINHFKIKGFSNPLLLDENTI